MLGICAEDAVEGVAALGGRALQIGEHLAGDGVARAPEALDVAYLLQALLLGGADQLDLSVVISPP